ncbi:MAG: hypothetical protein GX060_02520 [Firmicutes bacterium]|nr:hypothetical protein [Bacillota bacterium]
MKRAEEPRIQERPAVSYGAQTSGRSPTELLPTVGGYQRARMTQRQRQADKGHEHASYACAKAGEN